MWGFPGRVGFHLDQGAACTTADRGGTRSIPEVRCTESCVGLSWEGRVPSRPEVQPETTHDRGGTRSIPEGALHGILCGAFLGGSSSISTKGLTCTTHDQGGARSIPGVRCTESCVGLSWEGRVSSRPGASPAPPLTEVELGQSWATRSHPTLASQTTRSSDHSHQQPCSGRDSHCPVAEWAARSRHLQDGPCCPGHSG